MAGESETSGDTPSQAAAETANGPDKAARTKRIVTGAAIGIGSAAIVAALLYASRARKGGKA